MEPANLEPRATLSGPDFFSTDVSSARRFYRDLNPRRNVALAIVCGGVEDCTPDYLVHRETFPYFSIEYVTGGQGTLELDGCRHSLQPGMVFVYGPGVPHRIKGDSATPLTKYFVDFAGRRAEALLASACLSPGGTTQVHPTTECQPVFDELIRCGGRTSRESGRLCEKLFECLLLKIAEARAPSGATERLAFTTYRTCREHMRRQYAHLKTLQQVSAECHADAAYLCRLFRRYDHQSPYQYLLRLKMNRAAELLQEPGSLVKQVAEQLGFGDPFHFSRSFKRIFGVPPETFRGLRQAEPKRESGLVDTTRRAGEGPAGDAVGKRNSKTLGRASAQVR